MEQTLVLYSQDYQKHVHKLRKLLNLHMMIIWDILLHVLLILEQLLEHLYISIYQT